MKSNQTNYARIAQVSLGWSMSQTLPMGTQRAAKQLHLMAANLEITKNPGYQDARLMTTLLCELCKQIEHPDCEHRPPISALTSCQLFPLSVEAQKKYEIDVST